MSLKSSFFILLFCSSSLTIAADRSAKIALNWKAESEFGGIYAAQVEKIFEKHHLKVEILEGGAGTPSVQMVAGDKVDFGIASADEVVIAQSHGADVVALFATYQTNTQAIMTHDEVGYKSLADVFASHDKIAMQKGLPYAVYLTKKFAANTHAQIVPYLGGISNFLLDKNYSQQCFANSEPILAMNNGQKTKSFLVASEGFNPYTTVLVARKKFLTAHADIAKDVVQSVREGLQAYMTDPKKTNQFMTTLNPSVDILTLIKGAEAQRPFIGSKAGETIGQMKDERWSQLVDQLFELRLITKKPTIKLLYQNL